ncbi:hypothetical protein GALL_537590 [mine drainage metagenome]|uniref:Uncharacterized protein n=1 Tax=mine drainage metagenome TaxID=410659 RepID=A0A1J5P0V8_9ZZZZ
MNINAEQVSLEAIIFDQRAFRGLLEKNSRIHLLQIVARSPNGQATDRHVGRIHRGDIAVAAADKHRARLSGQYNAPIDPDRALVFAGGKLDDIAVLRPVQHSL